MINISIIKSLSNFNSRNIVLKSVLINNFKFQLLTSSNSSRHFSTYSDKDHKRKHEIWRDESDTDNTPMVRRRDGTIAPIDKTRGFVDYHRNAEPYRDPMERVFDWNEINFEDMVY